MHHETPQKLLKKVTVAFLPANTTALLQPLDAGPISATKARYRAAMLPVACHLLHQSEGLVVEQAPANSQPATLAELQVVHPSPLSSGEEDSQGTSMGSSQASVTRKSAPSGFKRRQPHRHPVQLVAAIKWMVAAWSGVSADTIRNCWRHTGILPGNEASDYEGESGIECTERPHEDMDLGVTAALEQVIAASGSDLTAEEFANIDNDCNGTRHEEVDVVAAGRGRG
jgi:hypothetical protein